jgi:hypothetical protein
MTRAEGRGRSWGVVAGLVLGAAAAFPRGAWGAEVHLFQGLIPAEPGDAKSVTVMVGLVSAAEIRPRLESIRVAFGKGEGRAPTSEIPFLDYATERSRATDVWRPPAVLGIVYEWAEGTPPEVLQGIHRLARRLPQRTVVLPTPFGQGHYPIVNPTTAGKVAGGGLDDQPLIPGDSIAFLESARANFKDLAGDGSPIRALVVISDGRDYQGGDDAAAFARLGKELRDAHIVTRVIGIPESGDRGQAVSNLHALANAADANLLIADSSVAIPNLIESAGTIFFDSVVVTAQIPWTKRAFGGAVVVSVEASSSGRTLRAEAGTVNVESNGTGVLLIALILLVLAGIGAGGFVAWRRGHGGSDDDVEAFLTDLQEMVRRKVSPERAIADLSRLHPEHVSDLGTLDLDSVDGARFGLLRSRAGRQRVRQIAEALLSEETQGSHGQPDKGRSGLASILAGALASDGNALDCVGQIRARLSERDWAPFARMSFTQLAAFLKDASEAHAALGSAKARAFTLDVQELLRRGDGHGAIRVAWLVRSAGPGLRGETLLVPTPRAVLGSRSDCEVQLASIGAAPRHLEIAESAGTFVVRPIDGGALRVEDTAVTGERPLVDGETLEIGKAQFVFLTAVDS